MAASLDIQGRRITTVLFTAQSLFSSGNIMLFTISSILAVRLGKDVTWTGVPMTVQLAGSATASWPLGRFMDRFGRRSGLILGQCCGFIGSLTAGFGVLGSSLSVFLTGLFLLGFARGALDTCRYAAADANPPSRRARAISFVVFGGTIGAILGPTLLQFTERYSALHGLTPMSVPWFVMAGFLLFSLILVFVFLHPDPSEIARILAQNERSDNSEKLLLIRPLSEIAKDVRIYLAISSILCGQLVMYLVMVVTPVYMSGCHRSIAAISWVIFAHVIGMYGLSFLGGWLVDRLGRVAMIVVGSIVLAVTCLIAPASNEPTWLALILFLVGLGWNLCFVTGSTLLSDLLRPGERGNLQGLVDTFVSIASGLSSLGGGLLLYSFGFYGTTWMSLFFATVPSVFVLALFVNRAQVGSKRPSKKGFAA